MDQDLVDLARLKRRTGRYRLWGLLVVVAIATGGVFWWASTDAALALEDDLATALDSVFGERADVPWCLGGCSATGHEWHSPGDLADVVGLVVERADEIGAEATIERGEPGAILVRIERTSSAVSVAITDGSWVNAAPAADGVAVWFTSVAAFEPSESG